MDAVLQHHPVPDQVEAEPGPFSLAPDRGVREPDGGHQIAPGELGQHPGADFVRLGGQGGEAFRLLGVGDVHVPTVELQGVVNEAAPVIDSMTAWIGPP